MKLVMLGAPGAGKGTQAKLISQQFDVSHISTGDMLREAVEKETELGIKAKAYMDEGRLVPDKLVISMVQERLGREDCQNGFTLDGFPRTVAQAEVLQDMLERIDKGLGMVLDIEVSEDMLIRRLTQRRQCRKCGKIYHLANNPSATEGVCDECGGEIYQRVDDEESAIKKRLEEYHSKTKPLISYYQELGLLRVIDGQQGTDDVFEDIKRVLKASRV